MHIGYGVTKKRYNRELEFRFRLGDTAAFAFPYITMENPQNAHDSIGFMIFTFVQEIWPFLVFANKSHTSSINTFPVARW